MGADLLHLGQQVRGHQDGDAVGGDLPDERAHLPGALWVQAVGRLVQDDQLPGLEQARRDGQALLHAQRVGPVVLLRCGQQADPFQRGRDPGIGGGRVGGRVHGVDPGQVRPAGKLRIEGGTLDQRADPGQHPRRPGGHRGGQQLVAAAGRENQAQQHPDRGGLAGSVRPEEPVDRAARHHHVQPVHGKLAAAEPLGQPMGDHGGLGRGPLITWVAVRAGGALRRLVRGCLQASAHLTWATSA
jgi:hypothetical protein